MPVQTWLALIVRFFGKPLTRSLPRISMVSGNGIVNGVPAGTDGTGHHNPAQRDDSHLAGAAADINYHAAGSFLYGQAGADSCCHGLFDQISFPCPGLDGCIHNGALLHFRYAAGNSYNDSGSHQGMVADGFMDKIFQHGLSDVKIRNDPVLHGTDGNDVARRAADHLLGLRTDFQHLIGLAVHSHNGRLTDNDPFAFTMHQRICGAKINSQIVGKSAKYVKHAALSPHILLQIPMLLEAVITPVPYDQMV